ncbi:hypothetical protein FQR65_LT05649 [Abscondita terminalis]|nr:hypothetical protein FQR65_LT05649 [Abscondita terminalis]
MSSNDVDCNEVTPSFTNVKGAFVLKSNLPPIVQVQLSNALTRIYKIYGESEQRILKFQKEVTNFYSYVYWNVVRNFDNVTDYSVYYIYLQMNNDRIFAFAYR